MAAYALLALTPALAAGLRVAALVILGGALFAMLVYVARKPITPSLAANEIIGIMRDLLLVTDREGRIRFANNAACSFLGYSREEMIGRPLDAFVVPTDDSEGSLQGRWVRDREYVFRTRMGQPIELTLSHSPVKHRGEINGAVIIGRDLRERKRYEWETRRALTLLESTLDSTADGILVLGQEGRVLTWNRRFAQMWDVAAKLIEHDEDHSLIAHLVARLADPNEFLRQLDAVREHTEAESVHVLELRDGRRLEQTSIGRMLDGAPLRVWSFRDVTARLAAEEALRDSEARYRLLFEQNAAGVCLASLAGRIVDCNATFAEMAGTTADELTHRELHELLASRSALEAIRLRLEETPTLRGLELELWRGDGERVSVLANISLLGRGERALLHMTAVDITHRKRAEQQIEYQAYHDALTHLPNRRLFVERLEMSLLTAKRARGNVAVLFIDVDRFKAVNDTLGHSVADALLVETAQRLRSCVRQTDTVARYGGDEFTIILPDLHRPEDAAQVAEKILERFVDPVAAGGTPVELTVSIGIAVYPHDGTDFDALLHNADDAMYRAKDAGRNGYQLCTEQLKTRAMERSSMQSRLRKAMHDGELTLAYEPQVSLATGLVAGAEAQVRWNDPERGAIEAGSFIPLAEDTRLIVPLGEWALFTACAQIRRWMDAGVPVRVAVDVWARQFEQRDLEHLVRRAVDESGIDPSLLELQIGETTAMRDVAIAAERLARLRDIGVSVAIHDFGSAYSSLRALQLLPATAVKLDRRLLENGSATDAAIAAAIIDVSRALALRVCAHGVDTPEQLEPLERRGCHEAQGACFGPAVDPDTFAERLAVLSHAE
jgi:diguanylate cyclase (GGDEF)-like protein/PAS domain S-box-containing protein